MVEHKSATNTYYTVVRLLELSFTRQIIDASENCLPPAYPLLFDDISDYLTPEHPGGQHEENKCISIITSNTVGRPLDRPADKPPCEYFIEAFGVC